MADTSDKLPFWFKQNRGIGPIRPEDDLLHPASFKGVPDDSATETQYFAFSIPEENIHAITYMWWHPNLKLCSGGVYVFQGFKTYMAEAELLDWRSFMSDAAIKNDLHEFRLDNGYGVKILEPNKRFHLTYNDAGRNSSVDLMIEGVLPGVMWADGNHFEQAMKVSGSLVLRGKHYTVDCYGTRDRSWGKPRSEEPLALPPASWMLGTFSDTFSFLCTVFDRSNAELSNKRTLVAPVPDDKALIGGWVYRDGTVGNIVQATKRVVRDPKTLVSTEIELSFIDEHDRRFEMRASAVASGSLQAWQNMFTRLNLMRWECDGLVGYGDNQEAFHADYLHSLR